MTVGSGGCSIGSNSTMKDVTNVNTVVDNIHAICNYTMSTVESQSVITRIPTSITFLNNSENENTGIIVNVNEGGYTASNNVVLGTLNINQSITFSKFPTKAKIGDILTVFCKPYYYKAGEINLHSACIKVKVTSISTLLTGTVISASDTYLAFVNTATDTMTITGMFLD